MIISKLNKIDNTQYFNNINACFDKKVAISSRETVKYYLLANSYN